MELNLFHCKVCGAELDLKEGCQVVTCRYCNSRFVQEQAEVESKLLAALGEEKREKIANARRNLWKALQETYTDSAQIVQWCDEILAILPDDFRANFYKVANRGNAAQVNAFLQKIDVDLHRDDCEDAIGFLIKSLRGEWLFSTEQLIERAFSNNPALYAKYISRYEEEAQKVESGLYDTTLPRDVFLMYSSKDIDKVMELTGALEEQNISCFVAARNLQHGRGAVADYESALESAIDHCAVVVYVSSESSRSLSCDAIKKELPYIRKRDLENAPAEFKNRYTSIPDRYKKPRVEYLLTPYTGRNVVERTTKEFFGTLQWVYNPEDVAARVTEILMTEPEEEEKEIPVSAPAADAPKKYCTKCAAENPLITKFCVECGNTDFADTLAEALEKKIAAAYEEKIRQLEEARRTEETGKNVETVPEKMKDSEGLEFSLNEDEDSYSVSGIGTCEDEDVVIPSYYNGKPITEIGEKAFCGCSDIKSITIPSSVTSIGKEAFSGCSSLKSITIPSSVTSIGEKAFSDCSSLKTITIPDSVTSISDCAFFGCGSLTSITIPDSVASIGKWAFSHCDNLTSIAIPDSVTSIDSFAFSCCSGLKAVYISDLAKWCAILFGSYSANPLYYAENLYINGVLTTDIVIPTDVKSIDDFVFYYCSSITSITIPDSVTRIGREAISSCRSLTNIAFQGTKKQWKAIKKGSNWKFNAGKFTVTCTDGTIGKLFA